MTKFGYKKCEKCGKEYKKSQESRHKCFNKIDDKVKCPVCGVTMANTNYYVHYKKCRSKEFWQEHKSKFLYLLKVLNKFNLEMKRRCYVGSRFEKRHYLDKNGIPGSIKKNQKLFCNLATVREQTALINLRRKLQEEDVELDNLYNERAIKDSVTYTFPGISVRQIIFEFIKNRNLTDDELIDYMDYIEYIDMKLYKKDYPTDDEIKESEYLYKKIMKLRQQYDYYDYFERFYYMLIECYENPENIRCEYCLRYFVNLKEHYKKCDKFKEAFYVNKPNTIVKYLRKFYDSKLWPTSKEVYYIDYYKQYCANYFTETIGKHIKNRILFREKIEYGQRMWREMQNGKKKGRTIVEELINEVREACGLEPRDFKIHKYKFQELDKEIKSDSDDDSDSIFSMIKNVDDKEDLNEEESKSEESYKPVFKRMSEKEVKNMKNLLQKNNKKVEKEKIKTEILCPKSDNEEEKDPILNLPEQKDDENLEEYFKKVDKHLNK